MRNFAGTVVLSVMVAATAATGCASVAKQHAQIAAEGESLRGELAELYVSKGAKDAALPLLQRIIVDHPKEAKPRVMYGSVLRDLGLYPQAESQFKLALALDPDRADAHAAYAILLDLTGRHPDALTHHRTSVVLAPGIADYRNNLGFSLLSAGDPESAIKPLEAALALDPSLGQAYANLGFAYGRAGRLDDAERTLKSGLGEAGALIDLAMIHEERGEDEAAAALRERAYALAPDLRPSNLATLAATRETTP